ncbi:hypothetical protein ACFL57_01960 [Candidatus Margulisiibacteriota bacterium]
MKVKNLILITLFLALSLQTAIAGQGQGGAFLNNPAGARAVGMGCAQTAAADDGYASFYNPAGIARAQSPEINTMVSSVFDLVDHKYASYIHPLGSEGTLGVSYISAGVGNIIASDYNSSTGLITETGDTFSYSASAIVLSAAGSIFELGDMLGIELRPLYAEDLFIGANIRFIQESLYNNRASGIGLDVGAISQVNSKLALGISFQNLISPRMCWDTEYKTVDQVPMVIKTGMSYKLDENTLLAVDFDLPYDQRVVYHIGVEHLLVSKKNMDMIIRSGINNGSWSLGLGLIYQGLKIDYAFAASTYSHLESTHRFSLGYAL